MRRVSTPKSAITYPLNRILSTEGKVRSLRVLALNPGALGISDLARKTGLTDRGTRIALISLEPTGIVELQGGGTASRVSFRVEHPLAESLVALFRAEEVRFETIIDTMRAAVEGLSPAPTAAWIQSPVATGRDLPGDAIVVAFLADAVSVDDAAIQLERALENLERSMDVTIEIRGLTRADLVAMTGAERDQMIDATPLVGPAPSALTEIIKPRKSTDRMRGRRHSDLDARGLAFGRAIAAAIKKDPALIERARVWIDKRTKKASAGEQRELDEWQRLLRTASPARLRRVLTDPGERATRLRQTLPFLDALSVSERDALIDAAESSPERGKSDT
jgi:DNA-binding IclR family transcriptional regulator